MNAHRSWHEPIVRLTGVRNVLTHVSSSHGLQKHWRWLVAVAAILPPFHNSIDDKFPKEKIRSTESSMDSDMGAARADIESSSMDSDMGAASAEPGPTVTNWSTPATKIDCFRIVMPDS